MKILVVSYLPKLQASRTKQLLNAFVQEVRDRDQLEYVDLLKDVPDFVTAEILDAYITRNYMGQLLSPEQKKAIATFDKMTKQFKSADIVVMAFPMYNFTIPAAIKAYFDSVMLKGQTFDLGEKGFVGLMEGKKALVLFSSGGAYTGKNEQYDYVTGLVKLEFGFMGFSDVRVISAQGVDISTNDVPKIIAIAQQRVKKVVKDWSL